MKRIALITEHDPNNRNHIATALAVNCAAAEIGFPVESSWLSTKDLDLDSLSEFGGLWFTTGTYASPQRAIAAIEHARRMKIPTFGTCSGFQHIILELARNVLGIEGAEHQEYNPSSPTILISGLSCSLRGRTVDISIKEDSLAGRLYGTNHASEEYYCNYGVAPQYVDRFMRAPEIRIVGSDAEGEIRIVELDNHPFFLTTLFVPQARSLELGSHPLVRGFIEAVSRNR